MKDTNECKQPRSRIWLNECQLSGSGESKEFQKAWRSYQPGIDNDVKADSS